MKRKVFGLSKKQTFFFNENIVYSYVNIMEGKNGLMQDYVDILTYIENNAFAHIPIANQHDE